VNQSSLAFVRAVFREYYAKARLQAPPAIETREFGFLQFGEKSIIRHLSFSNIEQVRRFAAENGPASISYSTAYYRYPDRQPMVAKEPYRFDLAFDIDADHIPTKCKRQHDFWFCQICDVRGPGVRKKCPVCHSEVVLAKFVCPECMNAAKEHVRNLIDILEGELGLRMQQVQISFSGRRGFHVRIFDEEVGGLTSEERREIVDYILLKEIEPRRHGFAFEQRGGKRVLASGPAVREGAISRRIVQVVKRYLEAVEKKALAMPSFLRPSGALLKEGEVVWENLGLRTYDEIRQLIECANEYAGVSLDPMVTCDDARLLRMPSSIHGGTGLLVTVVDDLDQFDPFNDPVVLSDDPVNVHIHYSPNVVLRDQPLGPFKHEVRRLPLFAAIYLICTGVAEIVG